MKNQEELKYNINCKLRNKIKIFVGSNFLKSYNIG